jgi:hypothetical protein
MLPAGSRHDLTTSGWVAATARCIESTLRLSTSERAADAQKRVPTAKNLYPEKGGDRSTVHRIHPTVIYLGTGGGRAEARPYRKKPIPREGR